MIQISLTNRGGGSGDATPTVQMTALKPFLGKKVLQQDDRMLLKLVNSGGIVSEAEFRVNRANGTTAKATGWNHYLFEMPENGDPIQVGLCGLSLIGRRSAAPAAAQDTSSSPTSLALTALQKLIKAAGTKVAAARQLGLTIDQFRGILNRAEATAKAAASKKKVASAIKGAVARGALKPANAAAKKAAPAKASKLEFHVMDGYHTVSDIKKALKVAKGNKTAAAKLLGTNPRTFGRWLEKAGL